MKILKCILCLSLFSLSITSHAQLDPTKIPDIIPPSPNASELGRYSNITAGLSSGSANISIPLLSFENGVAPVSLSYSASGVKVDQVASRVGMGWLLNAGGVITRTVINKQDEISTRIQPNVAGGFTQELKDDLNNIMLQGSTIDAEPDVFTYNFDGYGGKFILDSAMQVVQLNHSNLKIEFLNIAQASSTFRITTPEGTKYTFDVVERSESHSETYGSPNGLLSLRIPTAWYLSEIAFPNTKTVSFSYANCILNYPVAISEVHHRTYEGNEGYCEAENCPETYTQTLSRTVMYVEGKYLTAISYDNSQILFSYSDRLDVPGDKLLSSIQLKNDGILRRQFDLSYVNTLSSQSPIIYFQIAELRNRYFLQTVIEKGSDMVEVRKHSLVYNDMNGLPNRFSFSQDMMGFYNGKGNVSYFAPKPDLSTDQADFPLATANRDPDFNYAVKGSLGSITYPTGGKDSIQYESNISNVSKEYPETYSSKTVTIMGTDNPEIDDQAISTSFTIHDTLGQYAGLTKINAGVMIMYSEDDPPNMSGNFMHVEIVKSSNGVTVWGQSLTFGETINGMLVPGLQANVPYVLRITVLALHSGVRRYSATVRYVTKAPYTAFEPGVVGGIRVKKIITYDKVANSQVRRFYYGYLNNFSETSGSSRQIQTITKEEVTTHANCGPNSGLYYVTCKGAYLFSNSLNNLFVFGQNYIFYDNVIESIGGDDFEAGGIEHSYQFATDPIGRPVMGQFFVLGTKNTYSSHLSGLEKTQTIFKKVSGSFVNVKKIETSYVLDGRIDQGFPAYEVRKRYDHPAYALDLSGYDVQRYFYYKRWITKTNVKTSEYDVSGNLAMETTETFTYGNPTHTQVTKTSVVNSEQQTVDQIKKYPHEMVSESRDPNGYYQQMINRNIIAPVIEQIEQNSSVQTSKTLTNYYNPFTNIYLPQTVQVQKKTTDPLETRLQFLSYDGVANVTAVTKDDGPKMAYIWGYLRAYPTAQCVNTDTTQIAYNSFESEVTGNWNGIVAGNINSTYSITGSKSYNQTGFSLTRTGLTAATQYIVSYWTRNASAYTVSGTQSGYPVQGRTVNGWTYYEHVVTGVTTITVSGSGYIDELRAYPKTAQMSTFTYDPLIGKTSQCDANNIITYYEYDVAQRLSLIRDMDRNIIKKICYDYSGSPGTCGTGL